MSEDVFNAVVKEVTVGGRKFTLYDPHGYEVDEFLTKYYDENMMPIREKLPDANMALIKMCFRLTEEEIKRLPSRVYYKLLAEAGDYFKNLNNEVVEGEEKK